MEILKRNIDKIWILLHQVILSGSNFIMSILLARSLGIHSFGLYSLVLMIILFCSSIQQALTISPLLTLSPKKKGPQKELFIKGLFSINLTLAILSSLSIIGLSSIWTLIYPESRIATIAIPLGIGCLIFLQLDFVRKVAFLNTTPLKAVFCDGIGYMAQFIGVTYLISINSLTLETVLWSINLGWLISLIGLSISIKPRYTNIKNTKKVFAESWSFSNWLLGTSLLQWFSGNLFIITAGGMLGATALGAIRIAQNIIGVLSVIYLALENSVPQKLAQLVNKGGNNAMFNYLKKVGLYLIAFIVSISFLIFSLVEEIITFIYGAEYTEFSYVVTGFLILNVIISIVTPLRLAIRAMEKTKSIFSGYVVSTIISLTLVSPLVSYFDVTGVIIGLLITQLALFTWYISKIRPELSAYISHSQTSNL